MSKQVKSQEEIEQVKEMIRTFYRKIDEGKAEIVASVKSVSNSGMQRKIAFMGVYVDGEGKIRNINLTYYISLLCNYSIDKNIYALIVRGCGMNMIFACLYSLASVMGVTNYDKYTRYESI